MVLEAFGQHGLDPRRGLRDQRGVGRVGRGLRQGVADLDDPAVDRAHQQDQDREQRGDGQDDDEAADDRAPPQVALRSRSARALT